MFTKIVFTLATLAVALASPTCVCRKDKKLVCGSDGRTYDNECLLNCESTANPLIKISHKGPCRPQHLQPVPNPNCICPYIYQPVCASDGRTYSNDCEVNCAKAGRADLEVVRHGECEKQEQVQVANPVLPDCLCARNFRPVCGTNGRTYNNECMFRCAKSTDNSLAISKEGPCESVKVVENVEDLNSCVCRRHFKQVCGSDGNTYHNSCLLNCAKAKNSLLSVNHEGPCQDKVRVVN